MTAHSTGLSIPRGSRPWVPANGTPISTRHRSNVGAGGSCTSDRMRRGSLVAAEITPSGADDASTLPGPAGPDRGSHPAIHGGRTLTPRVDLRSDQRGRNRGCRDRDSAASLGAVGEFDGPSVGTTRTGAREDSYGGTTRVARGAGLPAAGAGGGRLVPIQVRARRSPAGEKQQGSKERGRNGMSYPQPDGRARKAELPRSGAMYDGPGKRCDSRPNRIAQ